MKFLRSACLAAIACTCAATASAQIDISGSGVDLSDVTGVTMPTDAGSVTAEDQTYVTRYDLSSSGLSSITQIIITDLANGGGAPGALSGFDLDGLIVSNDLIASAFSVGTLTELDISADVMAAAFTEGTQQAPADPLLFGTSAANTIDHAVATLTTMDADGLSPFTGGFLSMGEGGELVISLTTAIDPSNHQYLYIGGDIGGNGDEATVAVVPEPGSIALAAAAGVALVLIRRRRA